MGEKEAAATSKEGTGNKMTQIWTVVDTFNGREKALIAWIIIILAYCLVNKKLRSSIRDIAKLIFASKLTLVFAAMACYVTVLVLILKNLGVWDISLLKDTLFWFFGTGVVLFMNASKASGDPSQIKKMFLESFTLIVILEFIANLYSFHFLIEFMLVPVLVMITGMQMLANMEDKYKISRKPLTFILATYGFFVLFYSVKVAAADMDNFLSLHNLLSFAIPPILTVAFLPLIYVLALIMAYEMLFIRLSIFIKDNPKVLSFARWRIFLACNLNLKKLNRFADLYTKQFTLVKSRKDVLAVLNKV